MQWCTFRITPYFYDFLGSFFQFNFAEKSKYGAKEILQYNTW
nr:MAG TPA: hypothetical protein [Caudoviricetes sp.]